MRFNDQLHTILAANGNGQSAAVSLWRQCVDLLAQHDRAEGPGMDDGARDALLTRLRHIAPRVGESQRMASAVELGSRLRSPALVQLFAADRPAICAAALTRARLPDTAWPTLLSQLGPTARGILRHRRDLGAQTARALEAFGNVDFALSTDLAPEEYLLAPEAIVREPLPEAPPEDDQSIQKLVERIERFTEARRERLISVDEPDKVPTDPNEFARTLAARFAFETNADGAITWIDQGPRGALIGLNIGESALDGASGPDGYTLGAFRRRGGFRNARYTIAAGTSIAGDWRISGTPVFDTRSGRFQGYRGEARRPWPHEVPVQAFAGDAGDPLGSNLEPDSLRQLIHELRTPLNAILGFAEIIEKQLFGPASTAYRGLAGDIVVDARRLLGAFDDLDTASRIARGDTHATSRPVDMGIILTSVAARFDGGTPIALELPTRLAPVEIDPVQAERMVQHLIRTLVSVAETDETLRAGCRQIGESDAARVVLAVDRPMALRGLEESALLDPGYGADGEWPDAPLLGVGFSLRLVRSLAVSAGGRLDIEAGYFAISLPVVSEANVEDQGRV